MKYVGSKRRIAAEILPIILHAREDRQYFVDLFCGGCNLIDKVTGNRIANDIHEELIAMYLALQEGWLPPLDISEQEYRDIKNKLPATQAKYGKYWLATRAVVGFAYSYGAKYFGGYCRGNAANGTPRNYIQEGYRNIVKQIPDLLDIEFTNLPYNEVVMPANSIIYCDIPYKDTTKYKTNPFNYEDFYAWALLTSKKHKIFISEYSMPEEFECIWSKQQVSSLTKDTGAKVATERLFIPRK